MLAGKHLWSSGTMASVYNKYNINIPLLNIVCCPKLS